MDGSVGGGGGGCRSVRPAEKEGKGGNGSEEGPALALQVKGGREGTPCRGDWTTLTTTVKQGTHRAHHHHQRNILAIIFG